MLRERTALVSVFLCFVCVLARPPQTTARTKRCQTQDIIQRVQILMNAAPTQSLDGRQYTPTVLNYEQNCPKTTLNCFADELKVLIDEWGVHVCSDCSKLDLKVKKLANTNKPESPACGPCEVMPEEDAVKFLQDLITTLQLMNSKCPETARHVVLFFRELLTSPEHK
ncbi:interleukin 15, like isoform X3 [Embiotoca jacksoni]|uniref:interleukin 15, like isoform X3 n=1 Tax=Embiotoca jacksoni TaxID=100190 RepID=UPI0037048F99